MGGWNKGMTKETDERVKRNGLNISKVRIGKPLSDSHRRNLSIAKLGRSRPDLVGNHSYMVGNRYGVLIQGDPRSEESRQKRSEATTEDMLRRWKDPAYRDKIESSYNNSGYFFSKKNNDNIFWRCSYEPIALQILEADPAVVSFRRCPFRIPYLFHGKRHSYWSDFLVVYVDGSQKVLEVKSVWETENPKYNRRFLAKKEAAISFLNKLGIKYEVWTEEQLDARYV